MAPPNVAFGGDDAMQRRTFLLGLGGVIASGCTSLGEAAPPEPTMSGASIEATEVAGTATTSGSQLPTTDPLLAPPLPLSQSPFQLGICAGDPDLTSAVFWTRLVGDELPTEATVVLDVSTDPNFEFVNQSELVTTTSDVGYSIHHVLSMPPDVLFYYRFRGGDYTSAIGRVRVFGAAATSVRIASSSCQNPGGGAWAAHRHLAASHPDVMVWLGDFVYSSGQQTVEEYRELYASYLADADLQASRAACPWVALVDDNDIANDIAGPGTGTPVSDERRLAGLQTWWEHQPTRLPRPDSPFPELWRRVDLGAAAQLIATDARLQRTEESILGQTQAEWLARELSLAPAWSVVASSVMFSGFGGDEALVPYSWERYPADQAVLTAGPGPTVTLTGDLHAALVGHVGSVGELMAPPISSTLAPNYATAAPLASIVSDEIDWADASHGWLETVVTETELVAVYHRVDDVASPDSSITDGPTWHINAADGIPTAG